MRRNNDEDEAQTTIINGDTGYGDFINSEVVVIRGDVQRRTVIIGDTVTVEGDIHRNAVVIGQEHATVTGTVHTKGLIAAPNGQAGKVYGDTFLGDKDSVYDAFQEGVSEETLIEIEDNCDLLEITLFA